MIDGVKGVSIDSHFRITGVETKTVWRRLYTYILYSVHLRVIILLGHASEIS